MPDALQSVLTELGLAIAPFRAVKTADQAVDFFRQLGYEFPSAAFGSGLNAVATQATGLISAIEALVNANSHSALAAALTDAFGKLVAAVHAFEELPTALVADVGATAYLYD